MNKLLEKYGVKVLRNVCADEGMDGLAKLAKERNVGPKAIQQMLDVVGYRKVTLLVPATHYVKVLRDNNGQVEWSIRQKEL